MGAQARPQTGGQFGIVKHSRRNNLNHEIPALRMGSTGPGWQCPWCGRRDNHIRLLHGYAPDCVGYPTCATDEHSCLEKFGLGITRNGVRAGALYQIFKKDPRFEHVHRVQPSFYLDLCDFLHGTQSEPRARILLYQWNRLGSWQEYYVGRSSGTSNTASMMLRATTDMRNR